MKNFTVPTRDEVSENNQAIFDKLNGMIGFVPNLYAYFGHNETALSDYLALQNRKSSLRAKEREVINLVVSQVNGCDYCQAAHTAMGKMQGFTAEEIIEVRKAEISFDAKFDALAKFVKETTVKRGKPSPEAVEKLFAAGYTEANLVDIVMVIGDKIISNYLHGITQVAVDWEAAPKLEPTTANA
ncbi:MAG: carboxymuconolactone decarboxylase family protein [Pyrinomonadaceae bacterium]